MYVNLLYFVVCCNRYNLNLIHVFTVPSDIAPDGPSEGIEQLEDSVYQTRNVRRSGGGAITISEAVANFPVCTLQSQI